jgi:hypothetical protein
MNAVTENNYNSMDDSEDVDDIKIEKGNGCTAFIALVGVAFFLIVFGLIKYSANDYNVKNNKLSGCFGMVISNCTDCIQREFENKPMVDMVNRFLKQKKQFSSAMLHPSLT